MIGSLKTAKEIPAGSVVYFDAEKNCLVIFDDYSEKVYVMSMPFCHEWLAPDARVKIPGEAE